MAGTTLSLFARFLTVGVLNTGVGFGTICLFKWMFGAGDVAANVIGYLFGLVVSFVANRTWTFRHRGDIGRAAVRFAIVFVVAYASNLAAMLVLRNLLNVNAYAAHLIAVAPYTLLFFVGSRHFVFPDRAQGAVGEPSSPR